MCNTRGPVSRCLAGKTAERGGVREGKAWGKGERKGMEEAGCEIWQGKEERCEVLGRGKGRGAMGMGGGDEMAGCEV